MTLQEQMVLCEKVEYILTRNNYGQPYMNLYQNGVQLKVSSEFYRPEKLTIDIISSDGEKKCIFIENHNLVAVNLIAGLIITFDMEIALYQLVKRYLDYEKEYEDLIFQFNYERAGKLLRPETTIEVK